MFDVPPAAVCPIPSDLTAFTSLDSLPPAIQVDLKMKTGGLSPAGGPFEATDVGDGPKRRFVAAAGNPVLDVVIYEHGGRGYHRHVLVYDRMNYAGIPLLAFHKIIMDDISICDALTQALASLAHDTEPTILGGEPSSQHW
ncbi:hypothetical protein [Caulobacter sp. BK020]|uniref:hypothetical protein n=1 Tax=Caulobacter sp. BK020 TaxID=2512117 RepID=UPI00104CE88F|nr:hypothetical protein [Caulobacter sp. BK020]TCS05965.1 hypothetical protein EV278_12640 [Caulobacter sp. BK020]